MKDDKSTASTGVAQGGKKGGDAAAGAGAATDNSSIGSINVQS